MVFVIILYQDNSAIQTIGTCSLKTRIYSLYEETNKINNDNLS